MIYDLLTDNTNEIEALYSCNGRLSYVDMPNYLGGFVWCYRGCNNVFINKNKTDKKKREIILHELAHIELNQLCQTDRDLLEFKIDKYEDEADSYIKMIKERLNEKLENEKRITNHS